MPTDMVLLFETLLALVDPCLFLFFPALNFIYTYTRFPPFIELLFCFHIDFVPVRVSYLELESKLTRMSAILSHIFTCLCVVCNVTNYMHNFESWFDICLTVDIFLLNSTLLITCFIQVSDSLLHDASSNMETLIFCSQTLRSKVVFRSYRQILVISWSLFCLYLFLMPVIFKNDLQFVLLHL